MRYMFVALVAALAVLPPSRSFAQPVETLLSGLDYPWDIEARDGAIYLTEKAGTLGIYEDGKLTRMPVETSVPVLDDRGGGLLVGSTRQPRALVGVADRQQPQCERERR